MPRYKLEEEHVNHERWLVSYADFITLLFAFFVVMYSISQVNESKYRVLSNTLTETFNKPDFKFKPIQVEETTSGAADTKPIQLETVDVMERDGHGEVEQTVTQDTDRLPPQLENIREQMSSALSDLLRQQLVTLSGNEQWLEIALASSMLFDSGAAELKGKAEPILSKIAAILRDQPNAVRVEGFTDNVPIATSRYPSNWELSAARAVSVVQFLSEEGVQPVRLMAVGYGEFHPVADNLSESGRQRNRRVVLMISAGSEVRPRLPRIAPAKLQPSTPESANEAVQSPDATQMPQVQPSLAPAILPSPASQ